MPPPPASSDGVATIAVRRATLSDAPELDHAPVFPRPRSRRLSRSWLAVPDGEPTRTRRGQPRVIQLEEIRIEGRVQKPNAFYILEPLATWATKCSTFARASCARSSAASAASSVLSRSSRSLMTRRSARGCSIWGWRFVGWTLRIAEGSGIQPSTRSGRGRSDRHALRRMRLASGQRERARRIARQSASWVRAPRAERDDRGSRRRA